MPTYHYKCILCQHEFEQWQKISEEKLTNCPLCHEESLERLVSGGSFVLKGGGWFKDGYSNPPKT